jgi:hypothetical protein
MRREPYSVLADKKNTNKIGVGVAGGKVIDKPNPKKLINQEVTQEDEQGAASAWLAGLPEPLQPKALEGRLRKMVTGVSNGPVVSGDGNAVTEMSLRVLKSIKAVVEPLNLKTNAAVHEACGLLDDQEGRAFLAGDLMGVEIVRGTGLNESRKLGEQIDELLRNEKSRDATIRSGIWARKSKARGKEGGEAKLLKLDEELIRKRAEHWDAPLTLNLPDATAPIKKERERPPKVPQPPPPPRLPTATEIAKLDEAVVHGTARPTLRQRVAASRGPKRRWPKCSPSGCRQPR